MKPPVEKKKSTNKEIKVEEIVEFVDNYEELDNYYEDDFSDEERSKYQEGRESKTSNRMPSIL